MKGCRSVLYFKIYLGFNTHQEHSTNEQQKQVKLLSPQRFIKSPKRQPLGGKLHTHSATLVYQYGKLSSVPNIRKTNLMFHKLKHDLVNPFIR